MLSAHLKGDNVVLLRERGALYNGGFSRKKKKQKRLLVSELAFGRWGKKEREQRVLLV